MRDFFSGLSTDYRSRQKFFDEITFLNEDVRSELNLINWGLSSEEAIKLIAAIAGEYVAKCLTQFAYVILKAPVADGKKWFTSENPVIIHEVCLYDKKFYSNIIFSKSAVTGFYRFSDVFQIYPCDFASDPTSYYCHDFPAVIEYWVNLDEKFDVAEFWDDLKDFASVTARQMNRLHHLLKLLSTITNHRFFMYNETEYRWGIEVPATEMLTQEEKDQVNGQSSHFNEFFHSF